MNRLASESSPYLRQHADNPVDWYPWGEEAFAEARAKDKPILLSVGYSSCHWCHVMAHESFADGPTATIMNQLFVNVKVDREERPDIDAIYMEAVQAFSGSGGWPMTVFLAPDGRPFFAGTYYPNSPRHGMLSFAQLLERVHDVWLHQRTELMAQATQVTEAITRASDITADGEMPTVAVLHQGAATLSQQFDATWGGFGRAPKFPHSMALDALLRSHRSSGDRRTLDMVTVSLDAMASGGIYDQLTGGFARYSVDERWAVPHFEKMLYDNALLARVYLHAWQVTREPHYLQVCTETVEYVLGEMTHAQGGFFSAQDADSDGEEGTFARWTLGEVHDVLDEAGLSQHRDAVAAWYGITETGNFEGTNVLARAVRGDLIRPAPIDAARSALLARRRQRVQPALDDKVLTEWNALMLATLAEAAAATGNRRWLNAAITNASFLIAHLRVGGRWMRSWQADTGSRHLAYAADYAALVDAFVRLAEATGQRRWIDEAIATADVMIELFIDEHNGGLFSTGADAAPLLYRPKDLVDSATPSANSLAAVALLRLGALSGIERFAARARDIVAVYGSRPGEHPTAFANALSAIDLYTTGITEIVISGERRDLVETVQQRYLPNAVLAWGEPYESPLWHGREASAAYVCRDYRCFAPVTDTAALADLLVPAQR